MTAIACALVGERSVLIQGAYATVFLAPDALRRRLLSGRAVAVFVISTTVSRAAQTEEASNTLAGPRAVVRS